MPYTPIPDFHNTYVNADYKVARRNIGDAEWQLKNLIRTRGDHLTQAELDAAIELYQTMRTRLLEIAPHYTGLKESFDEIPAGVITTAPNP